MSKISALHYGHKESLKHSTEEIVFDGTLWKMQSASRNEVYKIGEREQLHCKCDLEHTECKVCTHAYACNCPDSAIKFNMCKHIHAVSRKINERCEEQQRDSEGFLIIEEHPNFIIGKQEAIIKELRHTLPNEDMEQSKAKLRQHFETILAKMESAEDVEVINRLVQPFIPALEARKLK